MENENVAMPADFPAENETSTEETSEEVEESPAPEVE